MNRFSKALQRTVQYKKPVKQEAKGSFAALVALIVFALIASGVVYNYLPILWAKFYAFTRTPEQRQVFGADLAVVVWSCIIGTVIAFVLIALKNSVYNTLKALPVLFRELFNPSDGKKK